MKLPRPLLHRIRRALARQLSNRPMTRADRHSLRLIEEWTGHRTPTPPLHPMTPRIQSILAGILALASALGSAEATGVIDLLAKQNSQFALLAAIVLPLLAAVVHFAKAAQEDLADDGLLNGSTRGTKPDLSPRDRIGLKALLIPALALLCLGLNSCSGIMSGITGQAPEPVAVKREGGTPVNVVKRDLILAETGPPATVYGLYDVGQVAALTGKVVDTGK